MLKHVLASLELILRKHQTSAEHIFKCDCKVNSITEQNEKGIHPSNLRDL